MQLMFSTLLHALDPERGRRRAYRLEVGRDLFGGWLVEVTFGRIGAGGRTVGYRELSRFDPDGWGLAI